MGVPMLILPEEHAAITLYPSPELRYCISAHTRGLYA